MMRALFLSRFASRLKNKTTVEAAMFESILTQQGQALERMMTNRPTANPALMEQAKQRLNEAVTMAIQASKETTDGNVQA